MNAGEDLLLAELRKIGKKHEGEPRSAMRRGYTEMRCVECNRIAPCDTNLAVARAIDTYRDLKKIEDNQERVKIVAEAKPIPPLELDEATAQKLASVLTVKVHEHRRANRKPLAGS